MFNYYLCSQGYLCLLCFYEISNGVLLCTNFQPSIQLCHTGSLKSESIYSYDRLVKCYMIYSIWACWLSLLYYVCWFRLKKVMEKMLIIQIILEVYHACRYFIVNITQNWGNISQDVKTVIWFSKEVIHITDKRMKFWHVSVLFHSYLSL